MDERLLAWQLVQQPAVNGMTDVGVLMPGWRHFRQMLLSPLRLNTHLRRAARKLDTGSGIQDVQHPRQDQDEHCPKGLTSKSSTPEQKEESVAQPDLRQDIHQ